MVCRVANNETEQTAILQQRYAIFVEEYGYLPPYDVQMRIEWDAYDEHAQLFGVWEREQLVASCRLILPNTPLGLPTIKNMVIEKDYDLKESITAEISRIAVAAGYRTFQKTRTILQHIQKSIYQFSSQLGITQWIGAIEPRFLFLLNRSNLPYRSIGPLQFLTGADRYPVALNAAEYLHAVKGEPC